MTTALPRSLSHAALSLLGALALHAACGAPSSAAPAPNAPIPPRAPAFDLSPKDPTVPACAASAIPSAAKRLTLDDFRAATVIGALGQPLGVVVEIEGTVVAGASLHDKIHQGEYLLRVEAAGGNRLAEPVVLEFRGYDLLPTNDFALYKLRTGHETGELGDREVAEIERGYVGEKVLLYGYEIAHYDGWPSCAPRSAPVPQTLAFGLRTSIVVMQLLSFGGRNG